MILDKPKQTIPGDIAIRFRHPQGHKILAVELNGKTWDDFQNNYVYLSNSSDKRVKIKVIFYQ